MWISCVILVLAAGFYVLRPLFAKAFDGNAGAPTETDTDYLDVRKTALYRNIKELEFEYTMGRLTEADFQHLVTEYKSEAVEILKKLEMLNASETKPEPGEPDGKADACPACGAKTIPGKKFCADCGARL